MRKLEVNAYAKINLFLEVKGRREDGYHELATLFARVGLCDRVRLEKTEEAGIELRLSNRSNLELGSPCDNIVYKAAKKFFAAFGIEPAVKITLFKRIPVGAGLGGGSSDAAAALSGLARLYGLDPKKSRRKLFGLALELGSDVPFFLLDETFALGRGRGEILRAVRASGKLPSVVLFYPGEPVYTAQAYARLKPGRPAETAAREADLKNILTALGAGRFCGARALALLFNRLEAPVMAGHKKVAMAKKSLIALGADAVLMSGSGAVVYALVCGRARARRVAAGVRGGRGHRVFLSDFC